MVCLLRDVCLLDGRTSGPARAAPRGRRPQPSFYRLRQRSPREGASVVVFFVFRSRRGDRIKVLYWDKDGYALWYKRLEKGSFRFPAMSSTSGVNHAEVKAADLMMILDGVDLGSVRRQRRYERQPA
jgi:transposase